MARRKPQRKKKPVRKRPVKTGPGPTMRLIRRIPPRAVIHAAIIILVAGFAAMGLATVDRYVKSLDDFRVRRLRLVDLPGWCPPEVVDHLEELPEDFGNNRIHEPQLVEHIAARYRRDPWVRKVRYVRADFPDTVSVSLDLRRPAYAVEKAGSYVLVDREGVVLPAQYARWSQTANPLKFVWGVRSDPPSAAGRRWRDPALQGGIETLEVIAGRPSLAKQLGITGADVSNFGGVIDTTASDVDIIADGDCTILWGRPPSTKRFGEVPAGKKLDYLEKVLETYPDPKGMEINARFADAGGGIVMTSRQNR